MTRLDGVSFGIQLEVSDSGCPISLLISLVGLVGCRVIRLWFPNYLGGISHSRLSALYWVGKY